MVFEGFSVGMMAANCYIIGCEETKEACVIDPGDEDKKILSKLEKHGLNCRYIILTHGHVDHIGALGDVQKATGAKVLIHKDDADMLTSPGKNLSSLMGGRLQFAAPDRELTDGDIIKVGKIKLEVIHTPGHTPGGICLKVDHFLITGDTLFAGSVGRSDFPGGSHEQLIASIKNKLLRFPDDTMVFPGHGPESNIGSEKQSNPFL
ncbi:MBL fold metallo-hydrolase [Desulfolucanica intricata]|uniref:MBL fold metallo-hydrolase n=1 Tax=Desulfolucanica intricata TaxID=1285191 RepID=UPI00082A8CAE|nr:MBL fold metallo-hydrolase [Desulfolucanica intricata]